MSLSTAKEKIEKAIRENSNLLTLYDEQLTDAQLKILIPDILKIKNLTLLDLRNNNLFDVSFLSELKGLTSLYLSSNNLSDVFFLTELKDLASLDLRNNNLSDVSFLTELKGLTSLYLGGNNLSDVSFLTELKDLAYLDLRNNPNLPFSDEVLEDWQNAPKILNFIREYYAEQNKGNLRKLNEAKLVVIGEANVGKTCVINRLIDKKFVKTDSTHGIQIRKWKEVKLENGEKVQMNVWDFGGQEIMHSTHQFFFTRRTVYILVINARENEDTNKTEEWLQRIQNLSQNSPVIIVGNKIDENNRGTDQTNLGYFDIERKKLNEKFPTLLKGVYGITSDVEKLQYNFLFDNFETAIKKEIQNLANIHDEFPTNWFEVKDKLELMKENKTSYIEYGEYIDYCIEAGMDNNQNRKTWIEFLNDIGVALTYSSDKDLGNYLAVLNPEWITSGVYSLIDNDEIKEKFKGVIKRKDVGKYLNEIDYPINTQEFIVKMMSKFKLVYVENDDRLYFPNLFPVDEPEIGIWNDCLHFQYAYNILEKSILGRFFVEMFDIRFEESYWRNGIVLKRGENKALIKADAQDKTISIKIDGNTNTRREFIAVIRHKFDEIHKKFDNLNYKERLGHPKYPNILRDYERLLKMERNNIEQEFVEELELNLNVKDWLDGFESEANRKNNQFENRVLSHLEQIITKQDESNLLLEQNIKKLAEEMQDTIFEVMMIIEKSFERLDANEQARFESLKNKPDFESTVTFVVPLLDKLGIKIESKAKLETALQMVKDKYNKLRGKETKELSEEDETKLLS